MQGKSCPGVFEAKGKSLLKTLLTLPGCGWKETGCRSRSHATLCCASLPLFHPFNPGANLCEGNFSCIRCLLSTRGEREPRTVHTLLRWNVCKGDFPTPVQVHPTSTEVESTEPCFMSKDPPPPWRFQGTLINLQIVQSLMV